MFDEDVHEAYDFTGPVLGSGAFATVLRVQDRMSGVEYAIKQVRSIICNISRGAWHESEQCTVAELHHGTVNLVAVSPRVANHPVCCTLSKVDVR